MNLETPKRFVLASLAVMLFSLTGTVAAQGYIGAGAGITTVDVCDDLSGPGISCDDKDTGLKIFGGFKFNPNFGVEASWVDLGEVSASGPGGSASVEVDGFGVAAVGMIPINPQFGVFGKLGAYMWDATGGGAASGASDDGTDIMFGAGVNWNFSSHFGLRAEWERFDIDGDDIDFLSIGAQYNF
ncbi:MAG TPA: outer membrane beta-barrel protein [Burkholderiales bacterium]|nr:outer membrane beta-barrel protein [Burkholderiales bacterium]